MLEIPNEILLTCSGQLVTITRLIKSHRDIIYGSWIKSESPEFYSGLSLIDRSMQPMYETYTKESSAFLFLMILALVGHLEMCLARNVLHCFHVASIVAYVDNGDFKKEKRLVYILCQNYLVSQ